MINSTDFRSTEHKLALVEEVRNTFGILAARQLFEKLGLPVPPEHLITPIEELEAEILPFPKK